MKAISILKKATILTTATVLMSAYTLVSQTSAIQYTPTHQGTTYPAFNVFTGVPQEGDESDFFRGKEETTAGPSVNNVQSACNDGTRFTLRVYVHNAANQTLNNGGSGPGVAHGTKVRVALPGQDASKFDLNSVISATNATSVSDGMSINCGGGKVVNLSYVNGSAKQFTGHTGTKALSDSIVTTGAPVGTMEPNGDVFGCFGQRVYVTLTVVVKEKQTPPPTPVSEGVCKAAELVVTNREEREVRVTVTGETNNAQIVGYQIDFGDGTKSTKQTDTHRYAQDGTYTVRTSVDVKLADGTVVKRTAEQCVKQVTFQKDKPPVIVTPPFTPTTPVQPAGGVGGPAELPAAGTGSVIAAFLGVSSISSILYYLVVRRFSLV